MNIINWLCKILGCTPNRPKVHIGTITEKSDAWVSEMLHPLNIKHLALDTKYYLASEEDFLGIIAWDWVDSLDYIPEVWDCENFAFLFQAHVALYYGLNQVATVLDYSAGHAYNLVLFGNKRYVFEPQTDGLVWQELSDEAFQRLTKIGDDDYILI